MVFQGAQSALNPVIKIFDQFYETLQVHNNYKPHHERINKRSSAPKVTKLLEFVN